MPSKVKGRDFIKFQINTDKFVVSYVPVLVIQTGSNGYSLLEERSINSIANMYAGPPVPSLFFERMFQLTALKETPPLMKSIHRSSWRGRLGTDTKLLPP